MRNGKEKGFWQARTLDGACEPHIPDSGVVCYYLPLAAGSQKKWGTKTEDFWCCHCTAVQANARFREFIYYKEDTSITIGQYMPSEMDTVVNGTPVRVALKESDLCGDCFEIKEVALIMRERPRYQQFCFKIEAQETAHISLRFRIPWWVCGDMAITVNGERYPYQTENGFAVVNGAWKMDEIQVLLPRKLTCRPLADEPAPGILFKTHKGRGSREVYCIFSCEKKTESGQQLIDQKRRGVKPHSNKDVFSFKICRRILKSYGFLCIKPCLQS